MSKIEEFYNALIKDPDLEIRGGQTREQAAMQEAEHRARQYNNNAQALAMATDVSKSPINALLDFVSKEYKGVSDEGIKAIHENMPEHGPQVKQRKPVRLPNPDVPEEKKSKKKESTAFTGELVTTRPADATGEFTQETKYKTINKPATTSKVKNLIDTVYQRAEESNLSEEDTQNLINETFNNPDYYKDNKNLEELRTSRANVNLNNNKQRSSRYKVLEEDAEGNPIEEAQVKFIGGTRSPSGKFTPSKPTTARADTDRHVERYSSAKESLGNTKPAKAIWETEGPEQNQFNGLAPEIKQVLNTIHSEASSNSKLTAAQQTVLLDVFDDESSGSAIRGIHEEMRDPATGDWKTSNDLTSGEADKTLEYERLQQANLDVRNKNVKDIVGKALERLGKNSETLELSDTQLNHIQDRISGENIDNDISMGQKDLETASAEPQEAIPDSEYPYKAQLERGQSSTNTSKNWLDNAKKFLFPGQSRVSNDVLASKLQSMANDGHFEADNPIYDGVTGAKPKESQLTKDGDAKVQNASAILGLFNDDHEAFSSYKATPNQANETAKNIRANEKAEIAVTNDPSDSKKQKEATKTKEKVNKDKAGDNQNENNENDKKDLKDLSNIEIKDNELVVDDQNKKTEGDIKTVIEKPEVEEPAAEQTKAEELGLVKEGQYYYEDDGQGNADRMTSPVHRVEINGEERFLTSLEQDGRPNWFEYTKENKGYKDPTDYSGTASTRKDLINKIQEKVGIYSDTEVEDETSEGGGDDETTENIPITEDVRSYMTELGYKDDQIAGMEEQGLFHPENIRTQTPFEVSDIKNLHNETHFDNYLKDNGIDKQGVEVEGGTPETPTIDENIQTLINTASSDENGTLKHMYEKEYGKDSDFVSFEEFKANKTEEFQKSGEKKTREILGKAQKTMKDLKVKQNKESSKETPDQKTKRIKQEQEQEKQAKVDAAEQKEIDDVKAYGVSDEARMARQIEEGQGGSDLMFHLDEKGEISHETHGGVDDKTGAHKNINDHDKKEKGSHPAHHHNKTMSSNLPPALREIEEEQAKEGDANEKIISDNRQFLQQKAQQGYMWNPNTKHWIHKENFSNLMSGHVGTNATIANGNHSSQGSPTFLAGNGNAAQGIFHLGTGYKVHKFGLGAVGKHLEAQHSKTGALASHIDSKLSATKVGDASGIYNSSGIGVPKAVKPKGFAQGMRAGAGGSQSGFNISPMVAGWRKVLGLEKSFMTNDALQQLVDSYSNKNKKI